MRARMYDPKLGRFVQTEPLIGMRPFKHYVYAGNDPISRIDRLGLQDEKQEEKTFTVHLVPEDPQQRVQFRADEARKARQAAVADWVRRLREDVKNDPAKTPISAHFNQSKLDLADALEKRDLARATEELVYQMNHSGFAMNVGFLIVGLQAFLPKTAMPEPPPEAVSPSVARPPAPPAQANSVKLFRVVSEAEYRSVMDTGKFSTGEGSMEGKWFWENPADAATFGQRIYRGTTFKVIEAEVPSSAAAKFTRLEKLDNIGPASWAELDQINVPGVTVREATQAVPQASGN